MLALALALVAQTMTALPSAPDGGPIDRFTAAIVLLAGAVLGLVKAVNALLAMRKALAAVVRGVEVATTAMRCDECAGKPEPCASCARLQRQTKGAIKAVAVVDGAESTLKAAVEAEIHAHGKPHTREIAALKPEDLNPEDSN